MLYPQMNEKREVYALNGIWNFACVDEEYIPTEKCQNAMRMAVPASMNEIVTDKRLRDHVGKVLYEREFSFPVSPDKRYRLRIGSVSHKCEVYCNGKKIGDGFNGHYPIDLPLDEISGDNRLSIVIDNRLDFSCLPVGKVEDGKQIIQHDFYNFTGIHRDVLIYSLPETPIEDITVHTVVGGDYRKVRVDVSTNNKVLSYTVRDREGNTVAESETAEFMIQNPERWAPKKPYLYTLCVRTETDCYTLKFGIRKVEVRGDAFFINDEPVYFRGFGMHEDFLLHGKGNDSALNIRNFELLKWINANAFRTSHYPYSEEIMDLADEYGIMVIDEVPAVCMWRWGNTFSPDKVNEKTKETHKKCIKQLIDRDKNHPSVVMWSLANEPETDNDVAYAYFSDVFSYTRTLTMLPLTFANCMYPETERCFGLCDVVMINRYYSWYSDHGDLSVVVRDLSREVEKIYAETHKPIVLSEFGADTIEGFHAVPSETFSEEYQTEILKENCETLDRYRYCIGELVWNFADFKTKQGLTRIRGNRKGVFTRDRQPKAAAFYLKARWADKHT